MVAGDGRVFVVSNQADTYYFANNNDRHSTFNAEERFLPVYKWAREDNTKVTHLDDFAQQFLGKCLLGEMISRYMVLVQAEQKILMMRPYPWFRFTCPSHSIGSAQHVLQWLGRSIHRPVTQRSLHEPDISRGDERVTSRSRSVRGS